MPAEIGQNAHFEIDDSAGTLTDLSEHCNQIDRTFDVALHDVTTFGDEWREFLAGLRNSTVTINLFSNSDTDDHIFKILSKQVSVEIGPYGEGNGNSRFTFEAFVQNWTGGTPVDGVDTGNLSLQVSGAVTYSTYP